jgi:GTP-binding protein
MKIARYITSAVNLETCPNDGKPEIAFLGRSNVGKSSFLNRILDRKNLAKTSSHPGHTRKLNFFLVDETFYFVDLPGYGFAKVPKHVRKDWNRMISEYLSRRETLRACVLIIDVRRDPDQRDMELAGDLVANNIPTLIIATKSDKLSQSKTAMAFRILEQHYLPLGVDQVILFSAVKGTGKKQVWQWINSKTPG